MASETDLETGYGPATHAGDNLLNDFVRGTARSFAAFAEAAGSRTATPAGLTLTDARSPLPFSNRATVERPVNDAPALVEHLRSFYEAPGGPYLVDSAWPTPDLSSFGFAKMGHPPLMVRPAGVAVPAPPPELRIVEVHDAATAADLERTLVYGYPAPMLQPFRAGCFLPERALAAPGWHHFVGYVDDEPVTTGAAYVDDNLVRVDNIATLDSARGKGYGLAITAAATAVDLSKPAALIASDLGRPTYERLGYVAILRVSYWIGMRAES